MPPSPAARPSSPSSPHSPQPPPPAPAAVSPSPPLEELSAESASAHNATRDHLSRLETLNASLLRAVRLHKAESARGGVALGTAVGERDSARDEVARLEDVVTEVGLERDAAREAVVVAGEVKEEILKTVVALRAEVKALEEKVEGGERRDEGVRGEIEDVLRRWGLMGREVLAREAVEDMGIGGGGREVEMGDGSEFDSFRERDTAVVGPEEVVEECVVERGSGEEDVLEEVDEEVSVSQEEADYTRKALSASALPLEEVSDNLREDALMKAKSASPTNRPGWSYRPKGKKPQPEGDDVNEGLPVYYPGDSMEGAVDTKKAEEGVGVVVSGGTEDYDDLVVPEAPTAPDAAGAAYCSDKSNSTALFMDARGESMTTGISSGGPSTVATRDEVVSMPLLPAVDEARTSQRLSRRWTKDHTKCEGGGGGKETTVKRRMKSYFKRVVGKGRGKPAAETAEGALETTAPREVKADSIAHVRPPSNIASTKEDEDDVSISNVLASSKEKFTPSEAVLETTDMAVGETALTPGR